MFKEQFDYIFVSISTSEYDYQIHYKNAHFILIFDIYSRKNFAFQSNVEWVHGSDQDEHLVIFESGHLSHDFKDFGHDFLDLFFCVKDP